MWKGEERREAVKKGRRRDGGGGIPKSTAAAVEGQPRVGVRCDGGSVGGGQPCLTCSKTLRWGGERGARKNKALCPPRHAGYTLVATAKLAAVAHPPARASARRPPAAAHPPRASTRHHGSHRRLAGATTRRWPREMAGMALAVHTAAPPRSPPPSLPTIRRTRRPPREIWCVGTLRSLLARRARSRTAGFGRWAAAAAACRVDPNRQR